jgi:surface polysaccharide O-acyltransferase-like enzyme
MRIKERSVSLDLYRFFCMFLITTTHITGYPKIIALLSSNHYNFYVTNLLFVLQRLSITGFVLISAYFLVNATDTVKKVISFWVQVLFYSVAILVFAAIFVPSSFSVNVLVKSVAPVLTYHYWYPVCYIFLLIMTPLLNKIIKNLSRKDHLSLILILGFFVSVFFHLNPFFDSYVFVGHYSHSLIWFILLYFIAAYIRLYGVRRKVLLGPVAFLISGILLLIVFVANRIAFNTGASALVTFFDKVDFNSYNALLSLVLSVSSFITFLYLKIPSKKWLTQTVSFLAPTTFGIYLIQEHNAVRDALWEFVNINQYAHSPWLFPMMLLVFLGLWVGAIGLYLLYRLADRLFLGKLEKLLVMAVQRVIAFVDRKFLSNPSDN